MDMTQFYDESHEKPGHLDASRYGEVPNKNAVNPIQERLQKIHPEIVCIEGRLEFLQAHPNEKIEDFIDSIHTVQDRLEKLSTKAILDGCDLDIRRHLYAEIVKMEHIKKQAFRLFMPAGYVESKTSSVRNPIEKKERVAVQNMKMEEPGVFGRMFSNVKKIFGKEKNIVEEEIPKPSMSGGTLRDFLSLMPGIESTNEMNARKQKEKEDIEKEALLQILRLPNHRSAPVSIVARLNELTDNEFLPTEREIWEEAMAYGEKNVEFANQYVVDLARRKANGEDIESFKELRELRKLHKKKLEEILPEMKDEPVLEVPDLVLPPVVEVDADTVHPVRFSDTTKKIEDEARKRRTTYQVHEEEAESIPDTVRTGLKEESEKFDQMIQEEKARIFERERDAFVRQQELATPVKMSQEEKDELLRQERMMWDAKKGLEKRRMLKEHITPSFLKKEEGEEKEMRTMVKNKMLRFVKEYADIEHIEELMEEVKQGLTESELVPYEQVKKTLSVPDDIRIAPELQKSIHRLLCAALLHYTSPKIEELWNKIVPIVDRLSKPKLKHRSEIREEKKAEVEKSVSISQAQKDELMAFADGGELTDGAQKYLHTSNGFFQGESMKAYVEFLKSHTVAMNQEQRMQLYSAMMRLRAAQVTGLTPIESDERIQQVEKLKDDIFIELQKKNKKKQDLTETEVSLLASFAVDGVLVPEYGELVKKLKNSLSEMQLGAFGFIEKKWNDRIRDHLSDELVQKKERLLIAELLNLKYRDIRIYTVPLVRAIENYIIDLTAPPITTQPKKEKTPKEKKNIDQGFNTLGLALAKSKIEAPSVEDGSPGKETVIHSTQIGIGELEPVVVEKPKVEEVKTAKKQKEILSNGDRKKLQAFAEKLNDTKLNLKDIKDIISKYNDAEGIDFSDVYNTTIIKLEHINPENLDSNKKKRAYFRAIVMAILNYDERKIDEQIELVLHV